MADTLCDNPAQGPTGDDLEKMKKAEDVIAEASVFSTVQIRSAQSLLLSSFPLLPLDCLNEPLHAGRRKGLRGRGR